MLYLPHTGRTLRDKGINRIGNLLVPNDNYCKFEDWMMPILDKLVEEQTEKVSATSEMNYRVIFYHPLMKPPLPLFISGNCMESCKNY